MESLIQSGSAEMYKVMNQHCQVKRYNIEYICYS